MSIEPFSIQISDAEIADLRARLARTRWPGEVAASGWTYGTNLAYLKELCAYWGHSFDWRAQEASLNAMPQFRTEVDGYGLHFVQAEGKGPAPLPLLFSHGWPGSIFEVHKILGPLTDPEAHGGEAADAFTLVAPSLPGYGFSEIPTAPDFGQVRTAELFDGVMQQLGHERYGAQGGDWGALVTAHLAQRFPERVVGAHMNMVAVRPDDATPQSEAEEEFLKQGSQWQRKEAGYQRIQGTKPQTLAYGLTDSPAGLAGWITEKWRTWSDCAGEIERRFSKDEILTNLSIYWFTGTINSSTRYYYEMAQNPARNGVHGYIDVPCGFAKFPVEISHPPRSWVERGCNLTHWSEFDRGGHFAAMEEPELLVQDIRDFFRPLR